MTSPAVVQSRTSSTILAGVILVAVIVAAYANSFAVPYVFDDIDGIARNPSLEQWRTAFQPPADVTTTGRPVANATFALNRAISGEAVWSFHAVNLLIHVAAALTLFGIVVRTLERRRPAHANPSDRSLQTYPAFGVALLWAVHPLQTEAVTYLSQRVESLAGLFVLLTLYAFIRATLAQTTRARVSWQIGSVVACGLGMATKETAVGAPLIVWLYDGIFVTDHFRGPWRSRRNYYLALIATWGVLAGCVAGAGTRNGSAGFGSGVSIWTYLLTQAHAIGRYAYLVVWPRGLTFDYGIWTAPGFRAVGPDFVAIAVLLVATGWAVARRSAFGFLGAWFFITLAPSSSFVPIASQTIAEHRMYLALAAPSAAVVVGLTFVLGWRGLWLAAGAAVVLAVATANRNLTYRTAERLWTDTVNKRPDNPRAYNNLGYAYVGEQRWADAIAICRRGLAVNPSFRGAHAIIGRALLELGHAAEAVPELAVAARQNPDEFDVRNNYAMALAAVGRSADALDQYRAALRVRPDAAETHYNFGNALARAGRIGEAETEYSAAIRLRPGYADAEANWALALEQSGQFAAAVRHFERALRIRDDAATQLDLARVLTEMHQLGEAETHYEAAVRLDPHLAEAHHNLAVVLMQLNRVADALTHFDRAAQLLPNSAMVHYEYGMALAAAGRVREAQVHAERAVQLNPNFKEARELLRSLQVADPAETSSR